MRQDELRKKRIEYMTKYKIFKGFIGKRADEKNEEKEKSTDAKF